MKFSTHPGVLTAPNWFPFRLDIEAEMISFIETDRGLLSASAFIDGRTPLTRTDQVTHVPVDHALGWLDATPAQPDRLIAHTAFCGSTLLARVLDIEGRSFAYKEPQILIDLAKLKAAGHAICKDKEKWRRLVAFCLAQFRLPWAQGEVCLIKPSNWANTLLPDMLSASRDMRLVLMRLDLEAFLIAVLRGGNARIGYCLSCLNHFLAGNSGQAKLARATDQAALPPLVKVLRLVAILHQIQVGIFNSLARKLPTEHVMQFTKEQLLLSPHETTLAASKTLELGLDAETCAASWTRNARNDSKQSDEIYDQQKALKADRDLAHRHKTEIADVMFWAGSTLQDT